MEHASLKIIRASLVRLNILIKSTVGPKVRRAFRVKNGGPITTPLERIKAARDSVACFIGGSSLDLTPDRDTGTLNGLCWRNLAIVFLT